MRKMEGMKRSLFTTLFLLAITTALVAAAHFFGATASVVTSGSLLGDLAVSFDEAGLGNGNIDYTISAAARADYGCINGGSNHPQATNKSSSNATVSAGATFQAKNGRVQATVNLPVPPPLAGFSCPGGQVAVLAKVTYANVTLSDTTSGTSISQADMTGSFDHTFFTFKH